MRIQGDKLKQKAAEQGVGPEDLAQAIARDGLKVNRAEQAIRSWMRGSDHPRCKAPDIEALAEALQCHVSEIARFTSEVRYHRGSPRKARLLADLIRGKSLSDATELLEFTPKRAAVNFRKALQAAMADADEAGADTEQLIITQSRVDEGPTIKRFHPKDRGRAHPIAKRTSHITVSLEVVG